MSKVVAVFDINDEKLEEVESGSVESAFGWLEDSGLYLDDYEKLDDNTNLRDLLKNQEEIQAQIIDEFAKEVKKFLNGITIAQITVDEISSELKSKYTKTQTPVAPTL